MYFARKVSSIRKFHGGNFPAAWNTFERKIKRSSQKESARFCKEAGLYFYCRSGGNEIRIRRVASVYFVARPKIKDVEACRKNRVTQLKSCSATFVRSIKSRSCEGEDVSCPKNAPIPSIIRNVSICPRSNTLIPSRIPLENNEKNVSPIEQ